MTIRYPVGIDDTINLPDVIDLETAVEGEVINRLRDAIISIESELGIKPSGVDTTVRTRLDNLDVSFQALVAQLNADLATMNGELVSLTNLVNDSIVTFSGDLSGTSSSQTVIGLQGRALSSTAPNDGQVLGWNAIASNWEPITVIASGGGSAPGGSDTYVQFNDTGALGGSSSFTYNKTNNVLSLSTALAVGASTGNPAASAGIIRIPYNQLSNMPILVAKDSGGTDQNFITYTAGNNWTIGNSNQQLFQVGTYYQLTSQTETTFEANGGHFFRDLDTNSQFELSGTKISIVVPTVQRSSTGGTTRDMDCTVTTTDTSITDLYTWTLDNFFVTAVDFMITARSTGSTTGASWRGCATFLRNGTTVTMTSSTITPQAIDATSGAWSVTIDNSGITGRVRVTGDAGVKFYGIVRHQMV